MQSKKLSAIESVTQSVVGYSVAVMTQMVILPLFGFAVTTGQSFAIAAVFASISMLKTYLVRRVFNGIEKG